MCDTNAGRDAIAATGPVHTGGARTDSGDAVVGTLNKTIIEALPASFSPLHQLPPPPRDFTGRREELDELLGQIAEHGVAISGVRGMGGIGKTALALVLADRLKDQYPDAQFYLNLKGTSKKPLTATDAMAHVIRGYKPEIKLPDDDGAVHGLYYSVLNGQKALLLMDNAATAEQVEPLTPPGGCTMLVTSRVRFMIPGLYAKDLDTLAPVDAADLLQLIAKRIDGDVAGEIARLCSYLPLALRLSASAIAERADLTPAQFVTRLTDEQKRLSHLDKVDVSIGLSDTLLTSKFRTRWYQLAVFPGKFDALAAAAVWQVDAEAATDALSELVRYSVVEWHKTDNRYHLHDLVRLYVDRRLTGEQRDSALLRHAEHSMHVAGATTILYLKGGDSVVSAVALFDREWENIEAGFAWSAEQATQSDDAAKLCSDYPGIAAYCLSLRQDPRDSIVWLEAALAAAKRLGERKAEPVHLGNLGNAHSRLGEQRRAIDYFQRQKELACETGNRVSEGNAIGGLGNAYLILGDERKALGFHDQYLSIAREVGDRRGEGNALGGLGIAHSGLGDPQRAIECFEQQLEIAREIGDRLGESGALCGLGNVYSNLGEPRRAIEYYEQVLVITREIGDRAGEALASWNLGGQHRKLGDLPRAIELMQVRVDYERVIGHADAEKQAASVDELRAKLNEQ